MCHVQLFVNCLKVYAWHQFSHHTKTLIQKLDNIKLSTVVCSATSTCFAITDTGDVLSWGNNDGGILAHGDKEERTYPAYIKSLQGRKIKKLCVTGEYSQTHCLALSDSGK